MRLVHILKTGLIRGNICIGVAAICFLTLVILAFIYGDIKTISTDPSDPLVLKGLRNYMEKSAFEKYHSATHTISVVGFWNAVIAVILRVRWRRRHPSTT